MERRINKKMGDYLYTLKNNLVEKIKEIQNNENQNDIMNILNYIYEYEKFEIKKEDCVKRKRVKNMVPIYERCCAKRANGEQCTRRKKNDNKNKETSQYCGTHIKGTPHGIINIDLNKEQKIISKVEVWVKDIKGINYYIDNNHNVYSHEDVISNKTNPAIIAKWVKNDDDVYSIPHFEI